MSDVIVPWTGSGAVADLPRRLKRPCDWGLEGAVMSLEVQLGTIEAYNRLVAMAERVRTRIEAGDVRAQNPLFATSLGYMPSAKERRRQRDADRRAGREEMEKGG